MAKLAKLLQAAAGAGTAGGLNVEEVFSTYLYTGNATAGTNITTGIDLSTEGGLLWTKKRSAAADHYLFDTETAAISGAFSKRLKSNATDPLGTEMNALTSFNTDGFTISTNGAVNGSGSDYCSWTFRKAPKFFDVVTYTGTGSARSVSHDLGHDVGVVIVKKTSGSSSAWRVWHRGLGGSNYLTLSSTAASASSTAVFSSAPTSTQINLGHSGSVNASGESYVAYLFAHNNSDGDFGPTGDQDIIKCGSYTGGNGTDVSVDLGFEPQWVMVKKSSGSANWVIADNMRGISSFSSGNNTKELEPNTSDAESFNEGIRLNPNGFTAFSNQGQWNGSGTYIYIAIRRGPMAVPESATDVFEAAYGNASGEPAFTSNFPVDFGIWHGTISSTNENRTSTRLTQGKTLDTDSTAAEQSSSAWAFDYQDGFMSSGGGSSNFATMWKRAPSFFDVVAYTGNGTAGRTVSHNLGAVPEMMWVKSRSNTRRWTVYHKDIGNTKRLVLNTSAAEQTNNDWNDTTPTDSVFTVSGGSDVNTSSYTYIAYLFASLAGVSKVGSYTGNGTNQNIDCGFSSGARFVLIKRTDSTGDWCLYDTERGLVAGDDKRLELNTTDAEDTNTDSIDPYSAGFNVVQESEANLNVNNADYIFYAIA